ncbi:MAG: hypothetical protein A2Y81_12430 [Nitrospirae bacterium RBG_13_43_8]|nr:MAG: hypothetical protein A2Y81_12430 [Nitrospirae bacterium RBG_13_43_8]
MTFFYKKIFPSAWIIAFGVGTLFLWTGDCGGTAPLKWFALISLIGGAIFLHWFSARIKTVTLKGDHNCAHKDRFCAYGALLKYEDFRD